MKKKHLNSKVYYISRKILIHILKNNSKISQQLLIGKTLQILKCLETKSLWYQIEAEIIKRWQKTQFLEKTALFLNLLSSKREIVDRYENIVCISIGSGNFESEKYIDSLLEKSNFFNWIGIDPFVGGKLDESNDRFKQISRRYSSELFLEIIENYKNSFIVVFANGSIHHIKITSDDLWTIRVFSDIFILIEEPLLTSFKSENLLKIVADLVVNWFLLREKNDLKFVNSDNFYVRYFKLSDLAVRNYFFLNHKVYPALSLSITT